MNLIKINIIRIKTIFYRLFSIISIISFIVHEVHPYFYHLIDLYFF
jgi:hypothetical protein